MTEFFRLCGLAAIGGAVILLLSGKEKELAALISSLLYVLSFFFVLRRAGDLIATAQIYIAVDNTCFLLELIRKIGGIALGSTVAVAICETVGQKNLGSVIEILAVTEVLRIAAPTISDMLEKLISFLGT